MSSLFGVPAGLALEHQSGDEQYDAGDTHDITDEDDEGHIKAEADSPESEAHHEGEYKNRPCVALGPSANSRALFLFEECRSGIEHQRAPFG